MARQTTWISFGEAQRRLACGRKALLGLIAAGRLTRRYVQGSRPRVKAEEVDGLAEASTVKAVER